MGMVAFARRQSIEPGQLAQLVKEHFPKGDVEADILKMCRGRTVNLVVQVDDSALELSLVEPAPRQGRLPIV